MWRMKKSIRVEEITTRTIKAADIMRAPKHVLRNILPPTSSSFLPTLNSVAETSTSSFSCLPLPTNTLQKQIRSSPSHSHKPLSPRRHPLTICNIILERRDGRWLF
ncbi:hypothetical protein HN51_067255 [Arachis hypogaea]